MLSRNGQALVVPSCSVMGYGPLRKVNPQLEKKPKRILKALQRKAVNYRHCVAEQALSLKRSEQLSSLAATPPNGKNIFSYKVLKCTVFPRTAWETSGRSAMMIKHCRSQWNRNEQRYPLDKLLQLLIRRFGDISISLVFFFHPVEEKKSKCPSILKLLQKKLLLYTCPVWKTIQPLPLNKSSSRRSYTLFDNTIWDRTPILVFIYYYTYYCCCYSI